MDTRFDFKNEEQKIYEEWERAGYFNPRYYPPSADQRGVPFSIILPPPNANADLHLGHAMYVIEDIMIRYHRMKGDATLWLPGADHAGFETQFVFEKNLAKAGKSRFDYESREKLFSDIWDFVQKNRGTMENQLRRLGFSLDWSRKKFTLDEDIQKIVYTTFKKLYDAGLVYRGERLVNYCTKCGTSFSDLEVKHEEVEGKLYFIRYPIVETRNCASLRTESPSRSEKNNKRSQFSNVETLHATSLRNEYSLASGYITVATTRPETMFGDTAIAVHPGDTRYKEFVGKTAINPVNGREIPIIADEYVTQEFGTGALKITPAHDENDFVVGKRHDLPQIQVIGFNGKLNENVPEEFRGLNVLAGREKVLEFLQKKDAIEKIEPHKMVVGKCYKCSRILEPLPLPQWFVKVAPLVAPAIKAIESGEIKFYPASQKERALEWLRNFHDWNISRQVVWGMRIPAWRCVKCSENSDNSVNQNSRKSETSENQNKTDSDSSDSPILRLSDKSEFSEFSEKGGWIITNGTKPDKCPKCRSVDLIQDPDTFDTWFSSGQWPFATLLHGQNINPVETRYCASNEDKSNVKLNDANVAQIDNAGETRSSASLQKNDFEKFYPTSVMETGYDILPWWVCRMIMLGIFATGKIPFKNVYLHGLVRDSKGQKMSKSKGNVVNPLDMVEKYGADALRASLLFGIGQGADVPFSEDKVRAMRNFTTKLWNMGRFILNSISLVETRYCASNEDKSNMKLNDANVAQIDNVGETHISASLQNKNIRTNPLEIRMNPCDMELPFYTKDMLGMNDDDKTIIKELDELISSATQNIEAYEFSQAFDMIYEFTWHRLADCYIEAIKERLKTGDMAAFAVLRHAFLNCLKLLHPFMPFVTEALWRQMPKKSDDMLIMSKWPEVSD